MNGWAAALNADSDRRHGIASGESLSQKMRSVTTAPTRTLEIVVQTISHVGMRTSLDDQAGSFTGRKPTKIGQSLLGHHHIHVMLGVIDVTDHGHHTGNLSSLCARLSYKDRKMRVAREIARSADAVHHAGSGDMGGSATVPAPHVPGKAGTDPRWTPYAGCRRNSGHSVRVKVAASSRSVPVLVHPDQQRPTLAQRGVIVRPVLRAVADGGMACPCNRMDSQCESLETRVLQQRPSEPPETGNGR